MKYRYAQSTVLVFCLLALSACVTTRQRGELKGIKKVYENTTARYNGYYNATVLLDESRASLEQGVTDNYNKILPVFKYLANDNPDAVASDLDEAAKKVSVVVNLHPESDWTDDSYLLLGKSQFLKQDFESAEETMEYFAEEFSPTGSVERRERQAKAKAENDRKAAEKRREEERKIREEEREEAADAREDRRKEQTKQREEVKKERAQTLKDRRKERARQRKEREKIMKRRKKVIEQNRKRKRAGKPLLPVPQVPGREKQTDEEKAMNAAAEAAQKAEEERKTREEEERKNKKEQEEAEKEAAEAEEEAKKAAPKNVKLEEEKTELNGKPESYFLKHRPAYQEGLLWLAKTYIERENYVRAEALLTELSQNPGTFTDIRQELMPTMAHYYIQREMWDEAAGALRESVELSKDRNERARYAFILGQIHQRAGRESDAAAAFEQVTKDATDYEMAFMARLNLELSGQTDPAAIQKVLERFLKEEKNAEYKDRIYYALADLNLRNGNRAAGIDYLKKSVFHSRGGLQKGESYARLAELYFEDENFVNAKLYYDSTLTIIPKTDERYTDLTLVRDNLTDIAKNLQTIQLQDSLLRIADLSPEEQNALAAEILEKREAEARAELLRAQQLAAQNLRDKKGGAIATNQAGAARSTFFAYDDKAVRRGEREFARLWGGRPLEDNWRRSNQQSLADFDDEGGFTEANDRRRGRNTVISQEEVDKILKDVPRSPEQRQAAELQIVEAMYALGGLYRDKLERNQKTVEILEDLNRRYPQNKYELDSWYYLYLAHTELGNSTRAAFYKQQIITKYPETTYANILRDPNYLASLLSDEAKLNAFYNEVYALFKDGRYQQSRDRIGKVDGQFGRDNALQARFALLNAMISGNLEGKPQYVGNLKTVIAKYPNTPESVRAKELLRLLGERVTAAPGSLSADLSRYKVENDKLHYVMILLKGEDVKLSAARTTLSDYHLSYHKLDKFRIASIFLGTGEDRVPVLVVRRFKDFAAADSYVQGAGRNAGDFLDGFDYEIFPVTQNNYRNVLKDKQMETYREFFEENY